MWSGLPPKASNQCQRRFLGYPLLISCSSADPTFDVFANPVQCLFNIQNAQVLGRFRVCALQLRGVWGGEDALASVEVDVDDVLAGKVGTLQLRVAVGTRNHGTTIHVHKHRITRATLRLGRRPDIEVQAVLSLAAILRLHFGLWASRPIRNGLVA